jgi:heme A synthase
MQPSADMLRPTAPGHTVTWGEILLLLVGAITFAGALNVVLAVAIRLIAVSWDY